MPEVRAAVRQLSIALAATAVLAAPPPIRADQEFLPISRAPEARFLPVARPASGAPGQIMPVEPARFFPISRRVEPARTVAARIRAFDGPARAVIRAERDFLGLPSAAVAPSPAAPALRRRPSEETVSHAWPLADGGQGRVTSRFGWRADPFTGERAFHAAVDIAAPAGTAAVATDAAVVEAIGEHPRLGRYVMLAYRDGSVATYGHLSDFAVASGDVVARGQRIGSVGSTGRATGPHLDFAFEVAGRRIDPLTVLRRPAALLAGR